MGLNFQVKNAWFYAFLLRKKLLVVRKTGTEGLNCTPGCWRCKTHGGLKILQEVQLPNIPSIRILPTNVKSGLS